MARAFFVRRTMYRMAQNASKPSRAASVFVVLLAAVLIASCRSSTVSPALVLDFASPVDPSLQTHLESIDATLRTRYGIQPEQTDIGVLDLRNGRVAMIHPDQIEYAASIAKIGILLAWFELHPDMATALDPKTRHELGLMIKVSSNEMATRFSRELGLATIQRVLNAYHFYDRKHGGGIWMGKHYGAGGERVGDPIANDSHAATVRQLLRFYLLMEQGRLVSRSASRTMLEIFASPGIPPDDHKFLKGLAGRDVKFLRKSGTWEDWLHDTADISGKGRHYVLVGLVHHPKGDEYLVDLARAIDDELLREAEKK